MTDEFYIVTRMARFDAIDTDSIAVCSIAGLAPETQYKYDYFHI